MKIASERVLLEAVVYSYAQRPRRVLVSDTYLTPRSIKQIGHQGFKSFGNPKWRLTRGHLVLDGFDLRLLCRVELGWLSQRR